jgi:hypothetical protein
MKTLACTLLLALCAFTAIAADAAGKWNGSFTPEGQDASTGLLILKQSGTEITGTGGPTADQQYPLANGKIDGNKITLELQHPSGMVLKMALVLDGDTLKGDASATGPQGEAMKAKLDLKREK